MYSTLHKQIAAPTESICSCEYLAPSLKVMKLQTAVEGLSCSMQAGTGGSKGRLHWWGLHRHVLQTFLSGAVLYIYSFSRSLLDLWTLFLNKPCPSHLRAPFCFPLCDFLPCTDPFHLSRQSAIFPRSHDLLHMKHWTVKCKHFFAVCVATEMTIFTGLEEGLSHDQSPLCSIACR